jgi:hypothetical protein
MGNTFGFWPEVLMPWRECSVMEERLRFVARLLDGEGMSDVCRELGISRKTGYKIFNRYTAELYRGSSRAYQGLPELEYPFHDKDILVTACGRICMHKKKINISTVLAGQRLGITEVEDGIWLVSFMHYDLGYIDLEQRDLATNRQPVRHEVVTHVLGTNCYPCLRAVQSEFGSGRGT